MANVDIQSLEQKAMALIAFMVSHTAQLEQVKKDIQDIMAQIATMKEANNKPFVVIEKLPNSSVLPQGKK